MNQKRRDIQYRRGYNAGRYCYGEWRLEVFDDVQYINSDNVSVGEVQDIINGGIIKVVVTGKVSYIKDSLYQGCSYLESVKILKGVKSIGEKAFDNCAHLTSVTIPDRVTSIGESAFSGCRSLKEILIPGSVNSIGGYAFSD